MALLEFILLFGGHCLYGDLCCFGFPTIAIYAVSNNVIFANTQFFQGNMGDHKKLFYMEIYGLINTQIDKWRIVCEFFQDC